MIYKILDQYSKLSRSSKNKETLRNSHNQEEPKKIRLLNVMWYPEWNPKTEKGLPANN